MGKSKFLLLIIIVTLGLIAGGVFLNQQQNPPTKSTFTVSMIADTFQPAKFTVPAGTVVTFVNNDSKPRWPASNLHPTHTIYPEFDPQQPVPAGKSWSFKFDRVGTWGFHDHLSPYITGTITVK